MTKTRLMAFLVLSVTLICGCLGGGGGGGTPAFEKDVAGITATLNRFAEALRTSDPAASGVFAQSTGTSETAKVLYVKDFGDDLSNPEDNQTWEFRVNPADITQPAPDTAIVKASKVMSSGTTLWLIFSMLKEEGAWKIQSINIEEISLSSLITANYFPIVPGNRMVYRSAYQGGSTSLYSREYSSSEIYQADGVTYHRVVTSGYGANLRSAAQLADGGSYYGKTANGEIWGYDPYINGGLPYRLLKAVYALGEKDVIVEKYSETEVYTTTITIGSQMKPLVTPLRTFMTLPVTQEESYTYNGVAGTHTAILYFAEGVGLVGQERFGHGSTVPESTDLLYERLVNGVVDSNNPAISAPATSQNVVVGQSMVPVQFSVNGGTAPITWELSGAPSGVTLTQTGYLSGTPDPNAPLTNYSLTIRVQDVYGRWSSLAYSLNVIATPILSVTPAGDSQTVTVGHLIQSVQFSVANATGNITWALTGQPAGVVISANGLMSGELSSSVPAGTYPITVIASDSIGATGSADYLIVVEAGAYQIKSYYPLVPDDQYTYVPVENGIASAARYTEFVSPQATVINGLNFFQEGSSYFDPGIPALRASVNPLHRVSLRAQTDPGNTPWYRAVDSDGNIWFYNQYTNGGVPFKSLRAWYNPGDVDVYVMVYDDGVDQYTATTTMTVASALEPSFFTPYATFSDVLKVTFVTEMDFGGGVKVTSKGEQYFAKDFGMIALADYDTVSQTEPTYYELLLSANLGGTLYNNLPQYTTGEILNSAIIGNIYTQVNLGVSGGNAPYSFALKTGSVLPDGLSLSSDGQITGTPTSQTTGEKSFTVVVKDAYHQSAEMLFKITVF